MTICLLEYFRNKACGWRLYRNLFAILYFPAKGPVPVTYSAEAFPLYIRFCLSLGLQTRSYLQWLILH
ncbi:hypothetical protein EDD22DRAFT_867792 [Suillus occidentalis]|nr:hypothetical protein EDD22DRAFT_867792 [Suillus occidentalis]